MVHNPLSRHTYLALLSRNAILIVYENEEPEDLTAWTELDNFQVGDKPARGEEVAFRVQFDPNPEPCYMALRQGVPKDGLALIVASMNRASIWRTKEISHSVSLGSNTSKEFYKACDLSGHRALVRDVAWAPGNVRGFDIVATACKDGFIRVFQISTPTPQAPPQKGQPSQPAPPLRSKDFAPHNLPPKIVVPASHSQSTRPSTTSGIGAGLASTRPFYSPSTSSVPSSSNANHSEAREGEIYHLATEMCRMEHGQKSPVWRVGFDSDGQLLGTSGDDGKLCLWRRQPSGIWSKSSELGMSREVIN